MKLPAHIEQIKKQGNFVLQEGAQHLREVQRFSRDEGLAVIAPRSRASSSAALASILVFLYVLFVAYDQVGLRAVVFAIAAYVIFSVLIWIGRAIREHWHSLLSHVRESGGRLDGSYFLWVFLVLLPSLTPIYVLAILFQKSDGPHHVLVTGVAAITAVLATVLLLRTKRFSSPPTLGLIWAWAFFGWLSYSLGDPLITWVLQAPLEATVQASDRRAPLPPSAGPKVAVALSGGGYRAAVLHAGVLSELNSRGFQVSHISSVSGGSIIGAHYAMGLEPKRFVDALVEGRLNLYRPLGSALNAIRLVFPLQIPLTEVRLFPWYDFDRSDVQSRVLESALFRHMTLDDLEKQRTEKRPRLQICATDLVSGYAVGISADGILLRGIPQPRFQREDGLLEHVDHAIRETRPNEWGKQQISRLVTASGAFPGAFSPLPFQLSEFDKLPARHVSLSDGGLTDNSGVRLLLERHFRSVRNSDDSWHIKHLVVSDGSQPLVAAAAGSSLIEELPRSVDIVYAGSGWRQLGDDVDAEKDLKMFFLRPQASNDCSNLTEDQVETFAKISTLENQFDAETAETIFEAGRALVACNEALNSLAAQSSAAVTKGDD
jgi:predicted acylesterase/phospholipase RssA